MVKTIINTREAADLLSIQPGTLRKNYLPKLCDGVHYFRPNARSVRFYKGPLLHWFQNQNNPIAHSKWLSEHSDS